MEPPKPKAVRAAHSGSSQSGLHLESTRNKTRTANKTAQYTAEITLNPPSSRVKLSVDQLHLLRMKFKSLALGAMPKAADASSGAVTSHANALVMAPVAAAPSAFQYCPAAASK